MLYEIHTKTKMFSQAASYFIADSSGVMFFDEQDQGIAFIPNVNLLLLRENEKAKENEKYHEELRRQVFNSVEGYVKKQL